MANRQAKKTLHRCRAETSITCADPEFGRVIGRGQIVCLAEEVGENKAGETVTLGELVRDPSLFEELEPAELEEPAPASSKPKPKTRGNK